MALIDRLQAESNNLIDLNNSEFQCKYSDSIAEKTGEGSPFKGLLNGGLGLGCNSRDPFMKSLYKWSI